jgi:hypothetical protein
MHKVRGNYSSCTCRSSENTCSSSGSAQEKGKMGQNRIKLSLAQKGGAFLSLTPPWRLMYFFLPVFFQSQSVLDQTQGTGVVFSWVYRKLYYIRSLEKLAQKQTERMEVTTCTDTYPRYHWWVAFCGLWKKPLWWEGHRIAWTWFGSLELLVNNHLLPRHLTFCTLNILDVFHNAHTKSSFSHYQEIS